MRIGIATIIDNNNHGNRLQNYALQQVLSTYGNTETIKNNPNDDIGNFWVALKKEVLDFAHLLKMFLKKNQNINRICLFKKFNRNISFSKKRFKKISSCDYDYFIVGSDQVWNPFHGRLTNCDILYNIEKNKCYSYAASFGISKIENKNDIDKIKNNICEFNRISVRENEAKEILKQISNRSDIEVLIDPTMLLLPSDWNGIIRKPKWLLDEKYILCYFLGEIGSKEKEYIENYSTKENLKIINIGNVKDEHYKCGPSEFVYLEKNAEIIFTDSFHSCVFGIIYEVPFVVFNRKTESKNENMNSRIDTLLSTFDLKDRKFDNENYIVKRDFKKCNIILENERNKSKVYLDSIFRKGE